MSKTQQNGEAEISLTARSISPQRDSRSQVDFQWHITVHKEVLSGGNYQVRVSLSDSDNGRELLTSDPVIMMLGQEYTIDLHGVPQAVEKLPGKSGTYGIDTIAVSYEQPDASQLRAKLQLDGSNLVFVVLNTRVHVEWLIGVRNIVMIDPQ